MESLQNHLSRSPINHKRNLLRPKLTERKSCMRMRQSSTNIILLLQKTMLRLELHISNGRLVVTATTGHWDHRIVPHNTKTAA